MTFLYEIPNMTSIMDLFHFANTVTSYYFGAGIVLGFFLVMLLAMKGYETEKAYATSALSSAVLCFLLMLPPLSMTSMSHLMIAGINAIVSLAVLYSSRPSE